MKVNQMELINYGFVYAGKWILCDKYTHGMNFGLNPNVRDIRAIYAFMVDNQVKYIGKCDTINQTFKGRMTNYRGKVGGSTTAQVPDKIKDSLQNCCSVEIFALSPECKLQYKGLDVDLVDGLEKALIKKFETLEAHGGWNKQL